MMQRTQQTASDYLPDTGKCTSDTVTYSVNRI